MDEKNIVLVGLALGKALHEQWAEDARKIYIEAEKAGKSPEECSKISSGVVKDGDILRKWRPPKDESFIYDEFDKKHDSKNGLIDIMNIPFENLPESWKGTNLEAGIVAAVLVGSVENFNIENLEQYISFFAPVVHEEWMRRNDWEKDSKPELFVPYSELSSEMKKLDDAHIIAAAKLFEALKNGKTIINVDEKVFETTRLKVEEIAQRLFGKNVKKGY